MVVRSRQGPCIGLSIWKSSESGQCDISNTSATSKGQWWKFELCDTKDHKQGGGGEILNYLLSH